MNIQIQSVSMTYPGGKAALREVSLSLGSPCLIGLLGPNGAGKSTLMKLMTAALGKGPQAKTRLSAPELRALR